MTVSFFHRRSPKFPARGFVLLLGLVVAQSLAAQSPSQTRNPRENLPTLESLETALDETKVATELDQTSKDAVSATLDRAINLLKAASNLEAETTDFKNSIEQGPKEVAAIRSELANREGGEKTNRRKGNCATPRRCHAGNDQHPTHLGKGPTQRVDEADP